MQWKASMSHDIKVTNVTCQGHYKRCGHNKLLICNPATTLTPKSSVNPFLSFWVSPVFIAWQSRGYVLSLSAQNTIALSGTEIAYENFIALVLICCILHMMSTSSRRGNVTLIGC